MQYIDQLNRTIYLPKTPQRIISIVPSQTELLFDLSLDETVVGITKFCIHPNNWCKLKTKIGGTKNINIAKVVALAPDLIIANKEENTKADVEALEKIAPIFISDINTLQDALNMIACIGNITNTSIKADTIINEIKNGFQILENQNDLINNNSKNTFCYLIWQKPFMTIGCDTFINNMLQYCGLQNVFAHTKRYPIIEINEIIATQPNLIFLSSEPYPFKQKDVNALQQLMPNSKIVLVDGEMFSWYGSRLTKSAKYFTELLNELRN